MQIVVCMKHRTLKDAFIENSKLWKESFSNSVKFSILLRHQALKNIAKILSMIFWIKLFITVQLFMEHMKMWRISETCFLENSKCFSQNSCCDMGDAQNWSQSCSKARLSGLQENQNSSALLDSMICHSRPLLSMKVIQSMLVMLPYFLESWTRLLKTRVTQNIGMSLSYKTPQRDAGKGFFWTNPVLSPTLY